jgi:signal transduction histidine kinase
MTATTHLLKKNKRYDGRKMLIFLLIHCLPYCIQGQPVVVATKINGKIRQIDHQTLTLKALEDDLMFELQANTDSFAFFLDNYDDQPIKTAFPTIRYTHLKGGNYVLNYWTENDKKRSAVGQINLYVEESLVETWWFYPTVVACVLALLGVIFYFWSIYDLRQKLKLETIRTRIAGDLHDEIGSDLGSLVLSIGTAQRKFGKNEAELSAKLEEIKETMRATAANLRDTVWIIQPNNDSFPQLLDKIRTFSMRLLSAANVTLNFENTMTDADAFPISMEQRRCVYLILREAVHNVAKHAQATQTRIYIARKKDGIRIIVSDNGIGFDPSVKTTDGNGLSNFKTRSAQCFIDFELTSTPSVGTTISMLIPEI